MNVSEDESLISELRLGPFANELTEIPESDYEVVCFTSDHGQSFCDLSLGRVGKGSAILRFHWQITSIRCAPGKLKYLAESESGMGAFIMDVTSELSAKQLQDVKLV